MRLQQFPMGHLQPAGHRFRRFRSPGPQPLKQLVGVGRLDENRHGLRIPCQNRKCTLNVDFEHDPLSGCQSGGDFVHKRAIPILAAVDLAAFQEIAGGPPPLELFGGDEVVVDPVLFPDTGRPRRGRDTGDQVGQVSQQPPQNRGFADARRAGDDNEFARKVCHPDVLTSRPVG